MSNGKQRPLLITLIAILYFVIGVLALLAGAILLLAGGSVEGYAIPAAILGGAMIVLGLIQIVIAGGFWNGWKVIWYLAVIIGIIAVLLCIVSVATGTYYAIITLIIQILLLVYIFRPKVKEFFGVS